MRFRVRFEYNEETGEVEVFRVDALAEGMREADHDSVHDRVSTELAGVVEQSAGIVEEPMPGVPVTRLAPTVMPTLADERTQQEALPPETLDG